MLFLSFRLITIAQKGHTFEAVVYTPTNDL